VSYSDWRMQLAFYSRRKLEPRGYKHRYRVGKYEKRNMDWLDRAKPVWIGGREIMWRIR